MKNQSVYLGLLAAIALLFTGCRNPYEVRAELQSLHPDAHLVCLPNTDTWLIRLPNGAILVQAGAGSVAPQYVLQPVQVIAPFRAEEFDPEYQYPTLELK